MRLLAGIRPVRRQQALRDVGAGVGLAAMNIPQALGYARIAGMPVVTGLYTLLLPLAAFAFIGSSRFLVVAADSATAAVLAGGLAPLAAPGSPHYIALAGSVALLVAGFLLLGRLFRLGFIADFLSQTVLVGFLTGVGFQVGIAVLGETLGLPVHSRRTVLQLAEVVRELPSVRLPTLLVSLGVLVTVLGLQRWAPKIPGALIAVVAAIAASAWWQFPAHGIATIGSVTGGLPHLHLPMPAWHEIPSLIPLAGSCAILIITQSAATARAYALRHRQKLSENQDLLGLSAANAAAALTGTFVVNGSPTQTAMVERAGGQSQIAQIATACVVACVLLFLTRPLEYLPQCVLGSLVLLVAIHLVDLRGLIAIRQESPGEYAVALTTAVVVVAAGVEPGILLAMILSLLRIVRHSYRPHTGVVISEPSSQSWHIVPPAPGVVTRPGLILYRFGAALFYANAPRFAEEILTLIGPSPTPVRWLIVDAEAITNIDYSAARVITQLHTELAEAGVALGFARMPSSAAADFQRHHLAAIIPSSMVFDTLHQSVQAFDSAPIPA
ncbi:MAG TPA: SulP family inorganic anion transporter [Acidobacteriaceae bacterium]|nr:SulP family inorganic anion transporter [Acidobacteriaceae bacterium]